MNAYRGRGGKAPATLILGTAWMSVVGLDSHAGYDIRLPSNRKLGGCES